MLVPTPGARWQQMWRLSLGEMVTAWGLYFLIHDHVRRIDKISIRTNPLSKVVVTDNWIVMVGAWPWSLQVRY